MTKRLLQIAAGTVVVAALLLVGDRTLIAHTTDLDLLKRSTAKGLLPPGSHVTRVIQSDKKRGLDGTSPAFISVAATTTLNPQQVRDYYRQQLVRLGFTSQLAASHPLNQLEDDYRKGKILASIDLPDRATTSIVAFKYDITHV